MTQTHVNAVNNVWGATTRPGSAPVGGTDRSLCVDSGSQPHRVMRRSIGESSRSKSFLESGLQLAHPAGCHFSHFTGNSPAPIPEQAEARTPNAITPAMNPTVYPKGRWTSSTHNHANLASTPLRELFWSAPSTSGLLEEAEQRIAAALRRILTPEPVQLFDDLYENLAC
jgi:hypothetical protein